MAVVEDPGSGKDRWTIEDLEARNTEIKTRLQELHSQNAGRAFPDADRDEWNQLHEEREENNKLAQELRVRDEQILALDTSPTNREDEPKFQTARPGSVRGGDIYDLSTITSSVANPQKAVGEMRDRAMRSVEAAVFPHIRADQTHTRGHLEKLLARDQSGLGRGAQPGAFAQHMLVTGSPTYDRAFGKYIGGQFLTPEESRALSLTTTEGGFAVPYQLDPTIIPTSNLALNPYRAIGRVEPITVDEWRGVSSAGVTAAYAAEATATTDNAPTLAQPTVSTEKAQAFIPYSIEIGMDWSGLQSEMATLLQDAKDELEATKFTLGSGTNEPFGVITGATTVYTAADTDSLVVADIFGLESALGPRFRPLASFVFNGITANRIRQFDTSGGASIWVDNLGLGLLSNQVPTPGLLQSRLLNHPAYESSAMASAMTTGQLVGVFGNFKYYLIADRIGLSVETIPHLFDVTNNRPTGQRGLYAYWRNGAKVLHANAFRTLKMG